jgi:hypothetical protein
VADESYPGLALTKRKEDKPKAGSREEHVQITVGLFNDATERDIAPEERLERAEVLHDMMKAADPPITTAELAEHIKFPRKFYDGMSYLSKY